MIIETELIMKDIEISTDSVNVTENFEKNDSDLKEKELDMHKIEQNVINDAEAIKNATETMYKHEIEIESLNEIQKECINMDPAKEDELKFKGIFTEGLREILSLTIFIFIALLYHNL